MKKINIGVAIDGSTTEDSDTIGHAGEHFATTLHIVICPDWLPKMDYYRLMFSLCGTIYLSEWLTATGDTIDYPVPQAAIGAEGTLKLQLVGYDSNTTGPDGDYKQIEKSHTMQFRVLESITDGNLVPGVAQSSLEIAVDAAQKAESGAEEAKTEAVTAYNNTMSAIGTSITPLAGGKIPVNYIPLSVVHTVVEITSEADLTTLTSDQVQINDVAAVVTGTGSSKIVSVSYQLLGTGDPKVRDNWVEMGTSHASTAAYAAQAGTAENTVKVGGYNALVVKQTDYDAISQKPAGTLYIVFPDAALGS